MSYTGSFLKAFEETMRNEGFDSNHPLDPGGMTFLGISKVYWPKWDGWVLVTEYLKTRKKETLDKLIEKAKDFYYINFWSPIQGDRLAIYSQDLAAEVFDTSVNMSPNRGIRFLQEALNLLNKNQKLYPDIPADGKIGNQTFNTLSVYITKSGTREQLMKRLLNVMNHLQGEFYINKMRSFPEKEEFRGWFDRT